MPVASCAACEARVPGRASFCPGCGGRIGDGGIALNVRSRITPAAAILVLALLAVGLAVFLFATGHPIGALLLLVASLIQFGLSGEAARHRPDSTGLASGAARVINRLRTEAHLTADAIAGRVRLRLERRRLRRSLTGLRGRRAGLLQILGDGVYRGDAEDADEALLAIRSLDDEIGAVESRLRTIAADRRPRPARPRLDPAPEPPEPAPAGLAEE